ncbi:hypothetical protein GLYMA_01G065000v4 [Glycine max]|nr:hypothetical protein GLYMA_01G065000v4 [Glycine max]KAG4403242.1 hypothetical protein GLYMA_01G065000v4 [Glycine max]KAH1161914.1 hypothetical protein GYH30_000684 [Glycine max]KAH1161916.1 hypothetical protein GYH30_000684 [Glycine max]
MELIIIITLLSFSFSYLIPTSSSQIQLEPSLQLEDGNTGAVVNTNLQLSDLPTIPRKLRFTEKVKEVDEARDLASNKQQEGSFASGSCIKSSEVLST